VEIATPRAAPDHAQGAWAPPALREKLRHRIKPFPKGGKMTHSIITRAQSIVLIGMVLATLVLLASRMPVGPLQPGGCRDASVGGTSAAALTVPASYDTGAHTCASTGSPIGYRMP
jgi:hypothetical protein